jgi:hypothetical protein
MSHYQQNGTRAELAAVRANGLALAEGLLGLAGLALYGGAGTVRRLAEGLIWGPESGSREPGCTHGGARVRHHYTCECVPPCYGCHR